MRLAARIRHPNVAHTVDVVTTWRRLTAGPFTVHEVAADHANLLREPWAGEVAAQHHLECHGPIETDLSRPPDDAHAAAADFGQNVVTRHLGPSELTV